MTVHRADVLVTCVCAALIFAVIPLRPLWLDEVLQLIGTRPERSAGEVVAYVPENPGSAPLGYLVQHAFLRILGVSRWSVRLPAALFATAASAAVIALARRLGLPRPWLAPLILVPLPLMLRYAAEARPYSQAVFLSVIATILFLRWGETPARRTLAGYAAVILAGVYTHPFTVFVAGGHALWGIAASRKQAAVGAVTVAVLAAASFIPWILYARSGWQETIVVSRFEFAASWKTPLMLFREISGAGYWGSAILFALAIFGARNVTRPVRALLAGGAAATFVGGIAADAVFGYFVAVRQFICALPGIAILAAARPVLWAVVALLAICGFRNWQYLSGATEDWESAAAALESALRAPSRCLIVEPRRDQRVYAALAPALARRPCQASAREIVLAVSPYRGARPLALPGGYKVTSEQSVGGTRILVLSR